MKYKAPFKHKGAILCENGRGPHQIYIYLKFYSVSLVQYKTQDKKVWGASDGACAIWKEKIEKLEGRVLSAQVLCCAVLSAQCSSAGVGNGAHWPDQGSLTCTSSIGFYLFKQKIYTWINACDLIQFIIYKQEMSRDWAFSAFLGFGSRAFQSASQFFAFPPPVIRLVPHPFVHNVYSLAIKWQYVDSAQTKIILSEYSVKDFLSNVISNQFHKM